MRRRLFSLCVLAASLTASTLQAEPIVGSGSGIFTNPGGPGGMVVSGVGTSLFTWGTPEVPGTDPSSIEFVGNSITTTTDTIFSFGSLEYFNGTVNGGTQATSVDLVVTLSLTTPAGVNEDFLYPLDLINTKNDGDTPEENADFVAFPDTLPTSIFFVDGIEYALELIGFGVVTGEGFIASDYFHVYEGETASAELLGRITSEATPGPTPVPEPSTFALFGIGALGLIGFQRRKRKQAA